MAKTRFEKALRLLLVRQALLRPGPRPAAWELARPHGSRMQIAECRLKKEPILWSVKSRPQPGTLIIVRVCVCVCQCDVGLSLSLCAERQAAQPTMPRYQPWCPAEQLIS